MEMSGQFKLELVELMGVVLVAEMPLLRRL